MSVRCRQGGFTLVEILVALTIGLFLSAGMIQMYVSNKQSFRFSDALARIQENGRYALALIARDMRMADFWGCSRGADLAVHLEPTGGCVTPDATSTNAIAGTDGTTGVPDGPDAITLRGAVGTGLIVDPASMTTALYVQPGTAATREVLDTGDIALVADCRGGDIFQVTNISGSSGNPTLVENAAGMGSPGNATDILSKLYDQTGELHGWREVAYWIEPGQNGQNALFIRENQCTGGVRREVLEGVQNMQIAYGEDVNDDGTADRYVRRTDVSSIDAVVSVRINLLMVSAEDNLVDQPQQITFDDFDGNADDTFTAADNRLYQVVTATFAVRNRSL